MFRIAPQSMAAPLRLVARAVAPSLSSLDSRGAFVLQHMKSLIIWQVPCSPVLYHVEGEGDLLNCSCGRVKTGVGNLCGDSSLSTS